MWLLRPIPSILRFGRLQVRVKYDGQKPTCRRCGETNHFASACNLTVCFNCEELGHEMGQCPRRKRCCICRQGHIGKYCQLSWVRDTIVTETTDETEDVIVHNQSENSLAAEELALGAAIADRFNVEDVVVAGKQSFEGISDVSDNSCVLSSDDPTPVFDATQEPEVMPSQQYTVINVISDPVLSKQQSAFSSQNTEITSQKDIFYLRPLLAAALLSLQTLQKFLLIFQPRPFLLLLNLNNNISTHQILKILNHLWSSNQSILKGKRRRARRSIIKKERKSKL